MNGFFLCPYSLPVLENAAELQIILEFLLNIYYKYLILNFFGYKMLVYGSFQKQDKANDKLQANFIYTSEPIMLPTSAQ